MDKSRKVKSENKITKKYKLRRIQLAVMRKNLRKANEWSKGVSYQTNLGINTANSNNNVIVTPVNDQTINSPRIVYFDIETTGLEETCEILQIAAVSDKYRFSVYALPTQSIPAEVTSINGFVVFTKHYSMLISCKI